MVSILHPDNVISFIHNKSNNYFSSVCIHLIHLIKDIKSKLFNCFIHFVISVFLKDKLIYVTVINNILFRIVVHIKMMFWIYLIFMICKWSCSIYVRSKYLKKWNIFSQLWHMINMQPFQGTSILMLFGHFSLSISMSHFSVQLQRITHYI